MVGSEWFWKKIAEKYFMKMFYNYVIMYPDNNC